MQIFIQADKIVIDYEVRLLCPKAYPNHPKGCPNFGKRPTCPPSAPFIDDFYDISKGLWVVWINFNLASHRRRMKEKHPNWTKRQTDCCLYWQGGVNKLLRNNVRQSLKFAYMSQHPQNRKSVEASYCPEAMGLNVTATLNHIGLKLEWPPQEVVRKVAIIGIRKEPR